MPDTQHLHTMPVRLLVVALLIALAAPLVACHSLSLDKAEGLSEDTPGVPAAAIASTLTPTIAESSAAPPDRAPTATPPAAGAATMSLPEPLSYLVPQAAGATLLRLTASGGTYTLAEDLDGFSTLAWSPDGRRGAAAVRRNAERALVVFDVPGRASHDVLTASLKGQLTFLAAGDWSRLLVTRVEATTAEVWAVDLPSGTARRLSMTTQPLVRWHVSGDGRWALVTTSGEGQQVTTLFAMDGKQAFEVGPIADGRADFSDDGRWLLAVGRDAAGGTLAARLVDLNTYPTDGVARVVATGDAITPAITDEYGRQRFFDPEGNWMGYALRNGDATEVRFRNLLTDQRAAFALKPGQEVDWLMLHPSSRRAVLATHIPGGGVGRLTLLHFDQQVEIPLLEDARSLRLLTRSADGRGGVEAVLPDGRHMLLLTDIPHGSSYVKLRGQVRSLAVDLTRGRTLAAIGPAGQEEVHLLDLNVGGTLTYFGHSAGGPERPPVGAFAPHGPALWVWLWQADGAARLMLATGEQKLAASVASGVMETSFSSDGTTLLLGGNGSGGRRLYVLTVDGEQPTYLADGRDGRWHAGP